MTARKDRPLLDGDQAAALSLHYRDGVFPVLHHRRLWSPLRLSADELQGLRAAAEQLRRAGRAQASTSVLRGRHLAVICDGPLPPVMRALARSFSDAGGTVTLLQAGAWRAKPPEALRDAARVLGRLYDAIDCCDLPRTVTEEIEREAGVPVLDGLAGGSHPLRLLADVMTLHTVVPEPSRELRVAIDARGNEVLHAALLRCAAATGLQLTEAAALAPGAQPEWSDDPEVELDLALPLASGRLRMPNTTPEMQVRLAGLLAEHETAVLLAAYVAALG